MYDMCGTPNIFNNITNIHIPISTIRKDSDLHDDYNLNKYVILSVDYQYSL